MIRSLHGTCLTTRWRMDPVMKTWELRLVGVYRGREASDRVGKFLDDADAGVRAAAADALGLLHGADGNGELRGSCL